MRENAVGYVLLRFLAIFAGKSTNIMYNLQNIYEPLRLNRRTLTFCGKKFQLYSLDGFQFDHIKFDEGKGLYVFTKGMMPFESEVGNGYSFMKLTHSLLYLGETGDLKTRLYDHGKYLVLKDYPAQFLGIYRCRETEKPEDVETTILESYFFKENTQQNTEIGD